MFDFIYDYLGWIIVGLIVGLIFLFGLAAKCEDEELRKCFFQEPRTAECEYKLWKYEARSRNTSVNTTTFVPVRR